MPFLFGAVKTFFFQLEVLIEHARLSVEYTGNVPVVSLYYSVCRSPSVECFYLFIF